MRELTFQKEIKYLTLGERRELVDHFKGTMHHQHLSQIAVERNIELQNRNKEDFYDLNYLELVSPQAYLVEACRLNLKEKIFEGIIYCLSTESAIYLSEASFQKEDNEIKFDKCRPFIDYVCFRYFNF